MRLNALFRTLTQSITGARSAYPTREDFMALEEFLHQRHTEDDALAYLAGVDGFLTAIALSPQPITPAAWINALFFDGLPEDRKSLERHYRTLVGRLRQITDDLMKEPPCYEPLFGDEWCSPDEEAMDAETWREGFQSATSLFNDVSAAVMKKKTEQARSWFMALALTEEEEFLLRRGEELAQSAAAVSENVLRLHNYWGKPTCSRDALESAPKHDLDAEPNKAQRTTAGTSQLSNGPLTATELTQLADFLRRHQVCNGYVADLYALDGFLTCIAISPVEIPPGAWLEDLFAGEFPPDHEMERHYPLMERHLKAIEAQLQKQPPAYRPLLETHPGLGGALAPLDAWAEGFMSATPLCEDAWSDAMLKKLQPWLHPIWNSANEARKSPRKRKGPKLTVEHVKKAVVGIKAAG